MQILNQNKTLDTIISRKNTRLMIDNDFQKICST